MKKQKACKACNAIYEGNKCPECGSQEYSEDWKGKVMIFNSENSEIAKALKIAKAKMFAIKSR